MLKPIVIETFALTARETAELLLVLAALSGYLRKSQLECTRGSIVVGCAFGLVIGSVGGWALQDGAAEFPWIYAIFLLFAAGLIVVASRMLTSMRAVERRIESVMETWLSRAPASVVVFVLALVAAARESLETAVFLHSQYLQTDDASAIATGALLGLTSACLLALVFRQLGRPVPLAVLFRLSALVLFLMAIGMVMGASAHLRAVLQMDVVPVIDALLPGGRWHGWFCAVLMLLPLHFVFRDWWRESSSPRRS